MRISEWSSDVCSSDLPRHSSSLSASSPRARPTAAGAGAGARATDRIGLASPATTSLPGVEAMDAELNTDWSAAGDAELADLISLRRAIHAEPEIGLHPPPTTEQPTATRANLPPEHRQSPPTRTTNPTL